MSEVPFNLEWKALGNEGGTGVLSAQRARVFGGWLVLVNAVLTFVPDAEGRWDGEDFGDGDYEYEEDEDGDEDE